MSHGPKSIVSGYLSEPWDFLVEADAATAFATAVMSAAPVKHPAHLGAVVPLTFPVVASATRLAEFLTDVIGLNRKRVLHGSQSYDYRRRLRVGDRLTCRIRVLEDSVKVGRRSGAMRVVVRQTEMRDAETQEMVLNEQATTIELAARDGERSSAPRSEPLKAEKERYFGPMSRADITRYAKVSGDRNALHLDDVAAQAAGYPSVFAHGMLTAGLLGTFVDDWLQSHEIHSFSVRFRELVFPGDSLTALGLNTTAASSKDNTLTHADLALVNQHGIPVATGSVIVRTHTTE